MESLRRSDVTRRRRSLHHLSCRAKLALSGWLLNCIQQPRISPVTAHPPYRNTALGKTLRDSLDELAKKQKINRLLAKVLLKFDKTAPASLFPRISNHVSFQGQLRSFRYNEHEWTFYLRKVEFKELMYEVARGLHGC